MKNRKKLVIILIGVIVLGIVLFVYQTFIKKQQIGRASCRERV